MVGIEQREAQNDRIEIAGQVFTGEQLQRHLVKKARARYEKSKDVPVKKVRFNEARMTIYRRDGQIAQVVVYVPLTIIEAGIEKAGEFEFYFDEDGELSPTVGLTELS